MLLMSTLNLTLTILFLLLSAPSPVILGSFILLLALTMSLTLALTLSSWFAFLLFLIYVGGLLVMFSYFTALSPNQPLHTPPYHRAPLIFLSLQTLSLFSPPALNFSPLSVSSPVSLLSLYSSKNLSLFIFLATILFLTLIIVVKITTDSAGPLRPFASPCAPTPPLPPIPYQTP